MITSSRIFHTCDYVSAGRLDEIWDELRVFHREKSCHLRLGRSKNRYPELFQSWVFARKVVSPGAIPRLLAHRWLTYEASKALSPDGNYFVGLALDEKTNSIKRRPHSALVRTIRDSLVVMTRKYSTSDSCSEMNAKRLTPPNPPLPLEELIHPDLPCTGRASGGATCP